MKPVAGDVVLVKSSGFLGEWPAIVVWVEAETGLLDVTVFTRSVVHHLYGVQRQGESSEKWGWRFREVAEGDTTKLPTCAAAVSTDGEQLFE
jgi:hypothetical protein